MLIRLVSHPTSNPLHIDKMIVLNGLPDKMVFDIRGGKKFLKEPWRADVEENIPKEIRSRFGTTKVLQHFPALDKTVAAIDEELEVYGLVLDYQNGQGEQIWQQIERMIDMNTARDEKLPVPAVVARSRIESFSLSVDDIPIVDFEAKSEERKEKPVDMKGPGLRCPVCNKTFDREPQMRMHKARTGHRESVAATV